MKHAPMIRTSSSVLASALVPGEPVRPSGAGTARSSPPITIGSTARMAR